MNSVDILRGGYFRRFHLDGYVILGKVIVCTRLQSIAMRIFGIVVLGLCRYYTPRKFPPCSTLNSISWKVFRNVWFHCGMYHWLKDWPKYNLPQSGLRLVDMRDVKQLAGGTIKGLSERGKSERLPDSLLPQFIEPGITIGYVERASWLISKDLGSKYWWRTWRWSCVTSVGVRAL